MAHLLDEELYRALMAVAACPTAPCHEGHVRACVLDGLKDLPHVTTRVDEFGNLHATYEHRSEHEPFRIVAHMDHPAFIVQRATGSDELHFAGGVEEKYFAGAEIVFHNEETTKPLGRAVIADTSFLDDMKRVMIDRAIPEAATFARWALPKARCTKRLFVSPACDDLAQVSMMLALLRRLALSDARANVHALFTRAEEIGFAGALAALKSKSPLMPMPTLSLETSKARGFARVEGGPVVRVGDRLSIFDSRITHWLETAFRDLQARRPGTIYQRLLMGGGTCEASVFQRAGWPTGALCVALNHYHNMGPGAAVRSESISLRDAQGLFDFLFFLATEGKSVSVADGAVAERFASLEAKALAVLGKTSGSPGSPDRYGSCEP
jgi:putative aminopeptidase FrvX